MNSLDNGQALVNLLCCFDIDLSIDSAFYNALWHFCWICVNCYWVTTCWGNREFYSWQENVGF